MGDTNAGLMGPRGSWGFCALFRPETSLKPTGHRTHGALTHKGLSIESIM